MSATAVAEFASDGDLVTRARAAVEQVCDPEIPVLTIADLGVLRSIDMASDGAIEIAITPTYSGCPAMDVIGFEVKAALIKAGIDNARVRQVLSPAWTTDWMSETGKAKLRAYGVAPPAARASRRALFGEESVACPHCGSQHTEKVSEFGSTACKALWRCTACREPFDYFKCI
ncbi:MAG: phenylacetate-CoA oxygenase subunit PaaJ [Methylobacteriaceae bacterium]|nr:phenylacetate-CoA oxygenase subunit PaaJ [Methylobacteriaceae bacterium]